MLLSQAHKLVAIIGNKNLVAFTFQHQLKQLAHRWLVIGNEDALRHEIPVYFCPLFCAVSNSPISNSLRWRCSLISIACTTNSMICSRVRDFSVVWSVLTIFFSTSAWIVAWISAWALPLLMSSLAWCSTLISSSLRSFS